MATTGWGQEDDRRRTKEAGFDHHLVKPVLPGHVQELLSAPSIGRCFGSPGGLESDVTVECEDPAAAPPRQRAAANGDAVWQV